MYNKVIKLISGHFYYSALLLFISCGSNDEPTINQSEIDDQIISEFISTNNLTAIKDNSGIYYEVVTSNQIGKEQSPLDKILTIYYTAKVLDGNIVELRSRASGLDSVKVKQGVGAIFPVGLDIGLSLMKQGEIFKFYIPSDLAYKTFSFENVIPANSILEIEVELVAIQNDANQLAGEVQLIDNYITINALNDTIANPLDSVELLVTGEYYKRTVAGIMNSSLMDDDIINIQYSGTFLDDPSSPFSTGTLEYNFNTGIVISGLDNGIAQMERGERALIIIPSQTAYKESAFYIPVNLGDQFVAEQFIPDYATDVPPFSVLVFDVILQ